MPIVRCNKPTIVRVAGVRFTAGTNEITKDELEKVKKNPIGARKIKRGVLEVLNNAEKEPSADELAEYVRQTSDRAKLEEYANHRFKKVRLAAQARLEEVSEKAGGKGKGKGGDDEPSEEAQKMANDHTTDELTAKAKPLNVEFGARDTKPVMAQKILDAEKAQGQQ